MDKLLWTAFALLITHAGACVYIALAKRGTIRKRGLVLIVGNLLLLYLFYIPTLLVPLNLRWLFAVCFLIGFFGLVQYVNWLRKRDEKRESN